MYIIKLTSFSRVFYASKFSLEWISLESFDLTQNVMLSRNTDISWLVLFLQMGKDPRLSRELLNVMHRVLLTREGVDTHQLAIDVVCRVVRAAKLQLKAASEDKSTTGQVLGKALYTLDYLHYLYFQYHSGSVISQQIIHCINRLGNCFFLIIEGWQNPAFLVVYYIDQGQ